MSKLVAAGTVIRGYGDCQVFINNIAQQEIQRQLAKMRQEHEQENEAMKTAVVCEQRKREGEAMKAAVIRGQRDHLLEQRVEEVGRIVHRRPTLWQRIKRWPGNAWGLLYGMYITYYAAICRLLEREE